MNVSSSLDFYGLYIMLLQKSTLIYPIVKSEARKNLRDLFIGKPADYIAGSAFIIITQVL